MLISRELSADDKKQSLQRAGSRNYLTEANYVEFAGVKVFEMILNHLWFLICLCHIFCSNSCNAIQVVTPTGNVLVKDLSLRVESGSNLLITGCFSLENIVIYFLPLISLMFPSPRLLDMLLFCLSSFISIIVEKSVMSFYWKWELP